MHDEDPNDDGPPALATTPQEVADDQQSFSEVIKINNERLNSKSAVGTRLPGTASVGSTLHDDCGLSSSEIFFQEAIEEEEETMDFEMLIADFV